MKSKLSLIIATLIISNTSFAKVGGVWDHLKENSMQYSIPCVLSLGVGLLLAKEDKMAIGLAGCAVSGAVTYYHLKDKKEMEQKMMQRTDAMNEALRKELREHVLKTGKEAMVAELKTETYKHIQESILNDEEFRLKLTAGLKKDFEEYRGVIDQVLAIKLGEFKSSISTEVENALINGPFIQMLEEKITQKLKDTNTELFVSKKQEIIKECVDEVINQIVVKQIGVKESKIKIIED